MEPEHSDMAAEQPGDHTAVGVRPRSSSSASDGDHSTYTISQPLWDALMSRGFSENAVKKSIVAGCVDESTCVKWIQLHEGHPELDTPLEDGVEVIIKAKRVLTEAEREAKVMELRERAKRIKEEEKLELQRKERERLEMARNMAKMKNEMDDLRRKRDIEEAQREKAADLEARRKVKIQIAADRLERAGHSKEEALAIAAREYEAMTEKARAEAAEKIAKLQAASQPSQSESSPGGGTWNLSALAAAASPESKLDALFAGDAPSNVERLVELIRKHLPVQQMEDCVRTLRLILKNILTDPFDMKKRTLRVTNKIVSDAILPLDEATLLLRWCGFDLSTDSNNNQILSLTTLVMRRIQYALTVLGE